MRPAAPLLVALVLAASCAPAAAPATTPAPTDTPAAAATATTSAGFAAQAAPTAAAPTIRLALENGWTAADRSSSGFAIGLPPRWRAIDLDPQTLDATLKGVDDPQLQALLRRQAGSLAGNGIDLFAFDFTPANAGASGFTTNLNVIKTELGTAISLDFYTQVNIAQLEQLDAVQKPVAHQRLTLPAGQMEQLTYKITLSSGQTTAVSSITQYAMLSGTTSYVLTFTTTPAQAAAYAPTFAKMAATFTLAK